MNNGKRSQRTAKAVRWMDLHQKLTSQRSKRWFLFVRCCSFVCRASELGHKCPCSLRENYKALCLLSTTTESSRGFCLLSEQRSGEVLDTTHAPRKYVENRVTTLNKSNCIVTSYHMYEKDRTDQHDNKLDVSFTRTIRRHQMA